MKLNLYMPARLKPIFEKELSLYLASLNKNDVQKAWYHLERAHIIGQRYPYEHTLTHWNMLLLGWHTKRIKEVFGQIIRLLLGAPFSLINKIPVGNVGSSRVSMVKPQPMPRDIEVWLSERDR